MKQKHLKILLVASLFIVACGWQIYNRRKAVRQTLETTASYIPVSARIESVYPTGRGFRRGTIITVIYTHEGAEYIKTLTRGGGYTKGQYRRGDTLSLYITPANPEELIDKALLNNRY
ncbi:MAG: hypothetical protein LBB84_03645 [Tannerellaceae bacterium]|jgi:hypothetical protein|nr:hypothetical protein [Tannerellaceae bacterium]